jgi:hypothetical protein
MTCKTRGWRRCGSTVRMNNPGLPETQEPMQKSNRFLLLASALTALIIVAAVGIYAWVYLFNPCEEEAVKQASAFLITQLKAHDDLYQFTTTVYQSGIDPPVNKMQQIFMDTQTVAVPVCMETAKNELLNYMRTVIRAFRAFEAGEEDITVRNLVDQSNTYYDNFNSELEAVNKCAPFCIP